MKIPTTPPTLHKLLATYSSAKNFLELFINSSSEVDGRYLHWDDVRRRTAPNGWSTEEWWLSIKSARQQNRKTVTLGDTSGNFFSHQATDSVQRSVSFIDQHAAGTLTSAVLPLTNPRSRDRYLVSSLIEEAITSSQLEGAVTTRTRAKQMLRAGAMPHTESERMVVNNFRAMQRIGELRSQPMSPDLVYEIHAIVTEGTLPESSAPPHFRQADDGVGVYDKAQNHLLHAPPHATEIDARLARMCEFANDEDDDAYLHPVVRAVILHFWLAYDHPFIDGNGRTARALFYWSMLSQGYWLAEFLSISRVIKQAPAQYARSFLHTETDGNDLTYFIVAQLRVIQQSIGELQRYLERKVLEVRDVEALVKSSTELNHRQTALLSHALRNPSAHYSVQSHQRSHAVSNQTARSDLEGLVSYEWLSRTRAGRAYSYRPAPSLEQRLRGTLGS